VFVKNARNVEIIVGVAFAVIPTVLGIGAAGLLGSGIINTAKDIRNSVSLLKTFGTGILYGNVLRRQAGGYLLQRDSWLAKIPGIVFAPEIFAKSLWKKNKNTQNKQDRQDSGGGGSGNPPPPPDKKSDGGTPPYPPDKKPSAIIIPFDEYIKKEQKE
jgi:hypothetical protein